MLQPPNLARLNQANLGLYECEIGNVQGVTNLIDS